MSFSLFLFRTYLLIRISRTYHTFTLNHHRRLFSSLFGHINVTFRDPNRQPTTWNARTCRTRLSLVTMLLQRAIIIYRSRITISLCTQTFLNGMRQCSQGVLRTSVLPSVRLHPIKRQRRASTLPFVSANIMSIPRLQALILQIPLIRLITRQVSAFFHPTLLFVTANTSRDNVRLVFVRHVRRHLHLRRIHVRLTSIHREPCANVRYLRVKFRSRIPSRFLHVIITRLGRLLRLPFKVSIRREREGFSQEGDLFYRTGRSKEIFSSEVGRREVLGLNDCLPSSVSELYFRLLWVTWFVV